MVIVQYGHEGEIAGGKLVSPGFHGVVDFSLAGIECADKTARIGLIYTSSYSIDWRKSQTSSMACSTRLTYLSLLRARAIIALP